MNRNPTHVMITENNKTTNQLFVVSPHFRGIIKRKGLVFHVASIVFVALPQKAGVFKKFTHVNFLNIIAKNIRTFGRIDRLQVPIAREKGKGALNLKGKLEKGTLTEN